MNLTHQIQKAQFAPEPVNYVNGHKIRYSAYWGTWCVSHDSIGVIAYSLTRYDAYKLAKNG